MSENTKIVQRAYDHFASGNIEALLNLLSYDIDWRLPEMTNVPFSGECRGQEDVSKFFATLAAVQEAEEFEPSEFIAQNDKVVALGHFKWHVKSTGMSYESDWVHVFTVCEGKIVRFQEYADTAAVTTAFSAKQKQPSKADG